MSWGTWQVNLDSQLKLFLEKWFMFGSVGEPTRAVICGTKLIKITMQAMTVATMQEGADGQQVRTMVKISAMKRWVLGSTDIRTRRDQHRLIAMEIPTVFKKLGLAGNNNHIWLVDKALYGLTSSPRDWSLYRDETIPSMSWSRQRQGRAVKGSFQKTPDENVGAWSKRVTSRGRPIGSA